MKFSGIIKIANCYLNRIKNHAKIIFSFSQTLLKKIFEKFNEKNYLQSYQTIHCYLVKLVTTAIFYRFFPFSFFLP